MAGKSLDDLNRLYHEAESVDREVFAEMRSNVLLVSGDHFQKLSKYAGENVRAKSSIESDQKLRIVKNQMHRAARIYESTLLDGAPGVLIKPQIETELQDVKDAELNMAVYKDGKVRYKFPEQFRNFAQDFIRVGECAVKMYWDPMAGDVVGYEPMLGDDGEELLEPVLDEAGNEAVDPETGEVVTNPIPDKSRPVFKGEFKFERIFGPNLLRHPSAENMRDNPCWILRKMVSIEDLKKKYAGDVEIMSKIHESSDDTYVVFNTTKGGYEKTKSQTMVREFYWPKCSEYAEGYYVHALNDVILEEGVLPNGIFPIIWKGFDEFITSPRARSILRVGRPFQAEINRASSTMALQQITLGDDKVLYQAGTKLAPGALLPGVRGVSYQGAQPIILPGRTGTQYLDYTNAQIAEFDRAMMLDEVQYENEQGQVDPFTLLFRTAAQKRKFKVYIEKYQEFMEDFVFTFLQLCQYYLPDDELIHAVGAREMVNIEEFRNASLLRTQITMEAQDETLETKFGRQLSLQYILQYVGKQLGQKEIGRLIKNMPFANFGDSVADLTMDEDNARNDMLALERGQMPEPNPYADPVYMVNKLTTRMRQPDFRFLPENVRQMYDQYKSYYDDIIVAQKEAMEAAQRGSIPVEGALVAVDMYMPDPEDPAKAKKVRLPQRAVEWLRSALEKQGDTMEKLEELNERALMEILARDQQDQMGAMPPPQVSGGGF